MHSLLVPLSVSPSIRFILNHSLVPPLNHPASHVVTLETKFPMLNMVQIYISPISASRNTRNSTVSTSTIVRLGLRDGFDFKTRPSLRQGRGNGPTPTGPRTSGRNPC